jgi:hypothetical protein
MMPVCSSVLRSVCVPCGQLWDAHCQRGAIALFFPTDHPTTDYMTDLMEWLHDIKQHASHPLNVVSDRRKAHDTQIYSCKITGLW